MNEKSYTNLRQGLVIKVLAIDPKKRRFFPRTLNARLRSVARLDAEYTQQEYNTCFEAVLKEFDLKPNEKANKN